MLACGAVAAMLATSGCGRAQTADLVKGKQLFAGKATCGSCHTLARANTRGMVGPNLDDAFLADKRDGLGKSTIRGLVENQIAHPRRGSAMPAGIKGPVTGAGPIVGSGGTSTFTVTLKPGTYTFFCEVPGHEAAGMKGTLVVK